MLSDDDEHPAENFDFQQILMDWSEAVSNFYVNYLSLTTCIENGDQTIINSEEIRIGQCPVSLLMRLAETMHRELEKLHREMNRLNSTLDDTHVDYKVLANHTAVLNALNRKAETRLALASLSAC